MTDCLESADTPVDARPAPLPPGARDDGDAALLQLCRVMVAATVQLGNSLQPNLSAMQIRTMTVLAAAPAGLSLGAVADSLAATPSATSRICARLVRDGLIERAAGPGNEIRLTLSASGTDALTRLNRARLDRLRPMLDAVAGEDRDAVLRTLSAFGETRHADRLW